MKLTHITTSNFLGARAVDLHLTKPIALIAGKNGAGKSSLRDAIALVLTADLGRVTLKKDAGSLITDGADSALAEVVVNGLSWAVAIDSAGKISDTQKGRETAPALPYILDAQRFANLDDNARRQFLLGLCGVKLDGPAVKQRLLDKGCAATKVEQAAPLLRAGFEAAAKEAASKARDAKAGWKTATGGETWGKEKAPKWQPAPLPEGADKAAADMEAIVAKRTAVDADLATAQQLLGAAKASERQRLEAQAKRSGLEAIADQLDRHQTKLSLDTSEMSAWEQKVADCKAKAGVAQPNPKAPGEFLLRGLASVTQDFLGLSERHPEMDWDTGLLTRASKHLYEFIQLHGEPSGEASKPDQESIEKLPEYENALRLMQSSVANGKRNLEAAQIAATQLKALDEMTAGVDLGGAEGKVTELLSKRTELNREIDTLRDIADKYGRRQVLIEQVAKLHADVMEWTAIADALAPDAIPAELMAEALGPINHRLAIAAGYAHWPMATIHDDMRVTFGLRDYALVSESEKWRADAMIAEAVSHLSGVKLLVLDQFDVLDGQGREDALYWLDDLAEAGEIDTALLFGTLKALPTALPDNIQSFWIENGTTNQLKEAA